jgi:hypothetical protein
MELEKSESSTISFGAALDAGGAACVAVATAAAAGVVTFSAAAAGFASTGAASIKRST